MKRCSHCGSDKPLAEFHCDRSRSDGRTAACRVCRTAHTLRWQRVNADRVSAYRDAHRAEINKRARAWAIAHPERSNAASLRWAKRHPERAAEKSRRRRARIAGGIVDRVRFEDVVARFGSDCYICSRTTIPGDRTIDHVIPVTRGGPHVLENLRVAHGTCNFRKGTRVVSFFEALLSRQEA